VRVTIRSLSGKSGHQTAGRTGSLAEVCLDRVTGLPAGYSGKLLAPNASKKIGPLSLDLLLKAAGLKMLLVDDRGF
jgi:hypothetical protein